MNSLKLAIKLVELENEWRAESDYYCRIGDMQDAISYEAKADAIIEVFIEVWGYNEHQAIRERAQDRVWLERERKKGEKANV